MKDSGKKLIKGTATYALGDFGTKILSFLIIPLYTYFISTEDMGVYDVLISTSGLLLPIVTLQISDAAYRWMISKKSEVIDCVSSTYKVLFATSAIYIFIALVIRCFIAIPYFELFSILLICSSWYSSMLKLVRGMGHQLLYAVIGILYTSIYLALNIVQIIMVHKGVESLFISAIIGCVVCIIVVLIKEPALRQIRTEVQTNLIKSFVIFSLPLIPNYLNWWVINSSDSYIVTVLIGASANGILSIAHKLPSLFQVLFGLFNTAWQDLFISSKRREVGFNTKVFDVVSKTSLSSICVLIPATKIFILVIMNENYQASCDLVSFYYLGAVFQGLSAFYGVGYIKKGKTSQAFITSVYASVVNIIVDIVLIQFVGLHAAAVSTFIGFVVMWIIREKHNREELGIAVNWKTIISLTAIDCLVSLVSIFSGIMVNAFLVVTLSIVFTILYRKEICFIVGFIRSKRKSRHENTKE